MNTPLTPPSTGTARLITRPALSDPPTVDMEALGLPEAQRARRSPAAQSKRRMNSRWAAWFGLGLGLSLLSAAPQAVAQADEPEAEEGDAARRFFDAAQRAFSEGRYVEAAHGFEQAYKHKPHPAPLINAGDAWDKAGEYAKAARAYQGVLTLAAANEQDRIDATDRLTRISPKLGVIELVGSKALRARIGDEEFRGGARVYLFPGEHRVTLVDVDGSGERLIALVAGTERSVELSTLLPAKSPTAGAGDEREPGGDAPEAHAGIRPLTFAAHGVGALGLIGGVVFGLQVNAAEDDYNQAPSQEALDRFKQNRLLTNIGFGVGLVGVGVGTFLLIQDLDGPKQVGQRRGFGSAARLSSPVDLQLSEDRAMLTARGRF